METNTIKKPTSFNLNPEIFRQFKADCANSGKMMSTVIEELMQVFHKSVTET